MVEFKTLGFPCFSSSCSWFCQRQMLIVRSIEFFTSAPFIPGGCLLPLPELLMKRSTLQVKMCSHLNA